MDYNNNNYDNNWNRENGQSSYDNGYNYGNDNLVGGYYDPYSYTPAPTQQSGMGIASLILGICGFFINPLAICSILAIIFGIIGVCKKNFNKGCAIAGLILGGIGILWDLFLTIFSGGIMLFC